jgi:aspartate carbamoyltransferase catalytic subunit
MLVNLVYEASTRTRASFEAAARRLGMLGIGEICLAGPAEFMPGDGATGGTRVYDNLDEAVRGANAIMMLRIQKERISGLHIPSADEYHRDRGLNAERLALAAPGCYVLRARMALMLTLTRAQV